MHGGLSEHKAVFSKVSEEWTFGKYKIFTQQQQYVLQQPVSSQTQIEGYCSNQQQLRDECVLGSIHLH